MSDCNYQDNDRSTYVLYNQISWGTYFNSGYSFDLASLAILQRVDALEVLLRAKSTTYVVLDQDTSQGQGPVSLSTPRTTQPLSLERPADWRPFYINIETVLTWPVFASLNFTERPGLRSLLRSDKSDAALPTLSLPADFGLYAAQQLLQKFLDNVHIFNPILEETMVREYMLATTVNGLGWDAQSCLMVTKPPIISAGQLSSHG